MELGKSAGQWLATWISKIAKAKDTTRVKRKKVAPTLPDDPPDVKLEKAQESLSALNFSAPKPNYTGATTVADSIRAETVADSTYIAKSDSLRGAIKGHQFDSDVQSYGAFVARLRRRSGQ